MTTKTKALIPNKCWLVETNGKKIGTLYRELQGFSFHSGGKKIILDNSLKVSQDLTIEIPEYTPEVQSAVSTNSVHGYPTSSKPFNGVYSIREKLPIYTASANSKSKLCAGYYLVLENEKWQKYFCPKLIKIHRYKYHGPFNTNDELEFKLNNLSNETN